MRRIRNGTVPNVPNVEVTARQLDFLARELSSHPQNLSDGQIRQGLSAMVQLLEHYFSEQGAGQARYRLMRRRASNEQRSWRYLDIINRMIDRPGGRSYRVILLGLFATLLQAKGTLRLDKDARPLLLIEDPETRLHPIMLSVAWHLLNLLPLQRIATTNSGELLSLTPVEHVCRLVRESSRVAAWRLGPSGLSTEDSRRISFARFVLTVRHRCLHAAGCWWKGKRKPGLSMNWRVSADIILMPKGSRSLSLPSPG